MPRYSLRALLVAVTVIASCGGLLRGCYDALTHVETAENVKSVGWLPATASNISYYRSYGYTAYEFDIPEKDFRSWAKWDMSPIKKPVQIARYSLMRRDTSMLGPDPSPEAFVKWTAIGHTTIDDGLYYNTRGGNGGGVTVAYDRSRGRAYFQSNPH